MFCRILGIPKPYLSARAETNVGEVDLQRVGRQPGRRGLLFQHRAWKRTPEPQISVTRPCGVARLGRSRVS